VVEDGDELLVLQGIKNFGFHKNPGGSRASDIIVQEGLRCVKLLTLDYVQVTDRISGYFK